MGATYAPAAESTLGFAAATRDESQIHTNEAGIRRQEIRTNPVGDFYFRARAEKLPGIILLGGSDGEPMSERSALLAAQGYAVLNLFYFGSDPLPKHFSEVPLEYLTNAVSWLQASASVDSARLGVIG